MISSPINDFAFSLYRRTTGRGENAVLSPKNVLDALVMVYAGSHGQTAKALKDVCLFHEDVRFAACQMGALRDALDQTASCKLATANGVWGQSGYAWNEKYLDLIRTKLRAAFQAVNYRNPEIHGATAALINAWVEEVTRGEDGEGKIKNLIDAAAFSTDTVMTLVSAIYFLGKWSQPFDPSLTRPGPFHGASGVTSECKYMTRQSHVRYRETALYQMVDLPYADDVMRMAVYLPSLNYRLADVEEHLTAGTFRASLEEASPSTSVLLTIPRWKARGRYDLRSPLTHMGLGVAFSDEADFSGMVRDETMEKAQGLKISNVIHQTFVDVTEKGTEAAAATAVIMKRCTGMMSPPPPKIFKANRPFLYVIHHVSTGVALFVGRVASPTLD